MTALASINLPRQLVVLRFCIEELHRRQQTDRRRAWLWQLKEKAARQALVMLKSEVGDDAGELSEWEQRQVMDRHELLKDPRLAAPTPAMRNWRHKLQARARCALQQSLEQLPRRREPIASAIQE